MRCALIEIASNIVSNIIVADPSIDPTPEGFLMIGITDDSQVSIGWGYNPFTNTFIDPNPPVIDEVQEGN